MTFIPQLFTTILPAAWATDMQIESQSWMLRCTCGFERSIWDVGGIRRKAKGNPRQFRRYP